MKIFIVILALASAIFARNFTNPGKFAVAAPMSGNSTVLALSTIPVLHDGEWICPYAGRIVYPYKKDESCPNIFIYHLVEVKPIFDERKNRWKGFICGYDQNISYGMTQLVIENVRQDCPDILVSTGGYKFVDSLFYDFDDEMDVYFDNGDITKQELEINEDVLEQFPVYRKQLQYRKEYNRRHKRLEKKYF